jgi:antirestriction factor ArdC-like protein
MAPNPDGSEYASGYYPSLAKKAAKKTAPRKSAARKFTPTAEQSAATAERREKMRKLARNVASMTPDQQSAIFSAHPAVTIEGRALSIFNTCFLVSQFESVSIVGGFNQWRKAGRIVRKGEHGLAIWIPIKRAEDPEKHEGEISSADLESPRFTLATVFDVSQTDEISA